MPNVKVIPQKLKRKKAVRVVAYARVSCPKNQMIASLSAQVDYYNNLITANYIKGLQEKPLILEKWDTAMWITTIHHCIVHRDDSITFVFRDGEKIDIPPAGRTRGIL